MGDSMSARKRALVIVGALSLACVLLGVGALAGGGAVYALTRTADWLGRWSEDISLPLRSWAVVVREEEAAAPATQTEDDELGIVIAAVEDDSPAAAAGVTRGDILLELDDQPINSRRALQEVLEGLDPGDQVVLRLLHGDDERRLTATLGERDGQAFLGVVPCCLVGGLRVSIPAAEGIPSGSALITEVVAGSPADAAGLQEGDIILAVDGEELGDELLLVDAIRARRPGDRVTLTVRSLVGDGDGELTVELGEHPDEEGLAYLGVTYVSAPPMRLRRFRPPQVPLPDERHIVLEAEPFREMIPERLLGVVVIEVDADGPAAEAGLKEQDVILNIDGEPVRTPQDVVEAVTARDPGDELSMTIRRDVGGDRADELELSMVLGKHPDDQERAYLGVRIGLGGTRWGRFGEEWGPEGWRFEFDLPDEWEFPFDEDELPEHFEFHFPPREWRDVLPGGRSV